MLHKYKYNKDEEWHEQSIDQPDVNELCVRRSWQLLTYRAFQGVHHQHGGDGQRDGRLEVFFEEIDRNLEKCMKLMINYH